MTRGLSSFRLAAVLALGVMAACSDSPSSLDPAVEKLTAPTVATVEAVAGSAQTAQTGADVAVAPSVVVKDNRGTPMAGVTVGFSVITGNGSLGSSTALTDAQGLASAGRWTLGNEGSNEVHASVGALPKVRFSATALAPPPVVVASAYGITTRFIGTLTARQQQAVAAAVARWQTSITRDLTDIPMNAPAAACFPTQPALRETVDDMLIFVEFVAIDGPGKTLGEAGPCYVRSDNGLPIVGHLKLDTDDLEQMERYGTLDDVVMHEIGHILGIGTLWSTKGLISGAGSDEPVFTGFGATSAWTILGGTGSVPVENTGSEGTRDGHWRETVFGDELMTGWINAAPNLISAMTIASLQDMGYGANPGSASNYKLGGNPKRGAQQGIEIEGHEEIMQPKFKVDRQGKNTKLFY